MIHTIEDNFDYQINQVFKDMVIDYEEEQSNNELDGDDIQSFSEWLWDNREEFGEKVYNRFDEYTDIDASTEEFNFIKY